MLTVPHQSLAEADREAILRRHRNAQRLLELLLVAIPYANLIEFPTDKYRSTRDLKRFLSYIKTSAFYHQYQRPRCEINGVKYIVASVVDYDIAYNGSSPIQMGSGRTLEWRVLRFFTLLAQLLFSDYIYPLVWD